jgi:hypothetical protein
LQGRKIIVAGSQAFGAHTGHHHALVLLVVSSVSGSNAEVFGSGLDVVQGFYRALGEGDGSQAASLIIPSKRKSGPLSAAEMSRFYGNLRTPLQLVDVRALGGSRYRATYTFETEGGRRCNGSSVVTTATLGGVDLISRIVAENGCWRTDRRLQSFMASVLSPWQASAHRRSPPQYRPRRVQAL